MAQIPVYISLEVGGLSTQGALISSTTRCRTKDFLPCNLALGKIHFATGTKHRFAYYESNATGSFISMTSWSTATEEALTWPEGKTYAAVYILVGYTDDRTVTSSNIPQIWYIYEKQGNTVPSIDGYAIQANNSRVQTNSSFKLSTVIPVEPNTAYRARHFRNTMLYNADFQLVRTLATSDIRNEIVTTGATEKFLMFCWKDTDGDMYFEELPIVRPKAQIPPIRVYEATETLFTSNGLRCLFPQSAEVTLKEQQAHSIHMVHPLDDGGAWKAIKMSRVLYVPINYRGEIKYQPLRIYKIQKQRQSGGNLAITIDALHVFYDLNAVVIQACTISSLACQAAIASAFSSIYRPTANAQASDSFAYSSDITDTASAEYENETLTSTLIGDDSSIASVYGAELYVDGFRFSLNTRMEGAQDDAFKAAYGLNLIGITATYSTEKTYSAVIGESSIAASTSTRTADPASSELPFDRTIYAKFSYQAGTPVEKFEDDLDKYAEDRAKVSASYQVTFADLPAYDAYKDFVNLQYHEVGDTGTVYDEDLDINTTQKIVEKKLDALTQTAISVTLGNTPASITQPKSYATTISNAMTTDDKDRTVLEAEIDQQLAAMLLPKQTASGAPPLSVTTHLTAPIETWAVYGAASGVGVTRSGSIKIVVSINGDEVAAVTVPQKLYSGDYIRRIEGGSGILHLEHDSSGNPLSAPTEQSITIPVLLMAKGTNTVTVAGTVQPENIEIIYR